MLKEDKDTVNLLLNNSDLAPIRITLGLAKSSAIKRRVFFLAFLGKIRLLGLVLCVKLTSFFLGARCEITKICSDYHQY
jgi:hypothetical protein